VKVMRLPDGVATGGGVQLVGGAVFAGAGVGSAATAGATSLPTIGVGFNGEGAGDALPGAVTASAVPPMIAAAITTITGCSRRMSPFRGQSCRP
jgi:hypothetical protein